MRKENRKILGPLLLFLTNERKEREKKYMKKLEESLEWNERDEQMMKKIWGDKK